MIIGSSVPVLHKQWLLPHWGLKRINGATEHHTCSSGALPPQLWPSCPGMAVGYTRSKRGAGRHWHPRAAADWGAQPHLQIHQSCWSHTMETQRETVKHSTHLTNAIPPKTSRERPKSAPYPRLKNSKRTSKFPNFGELGLLLWKFFLKSLTMPKKLKGRTLWDFSTSILLQNSKKLKGDPFVGKIFFWKKVAQCRKNLKGGPLVSSGIVC